MALHPAETTITGISASAFRSEEMSNVSFQNLCTPPIPPVAKTFIPALLASSIVAETVVPPLFFRATA